MERELAKPHGLEVVHHAEDALLHLAGVLGAEDDHLHALEVDLDRGGGRHAGREAVRGELAGVVDDEVGFAEVDELLGCGTDEHVVLITKSDTLQFIRGSIRLTMKSAWYARLAMTRTLIRYFGSQPANPSKT